MSRDSHTITFWGVRGSIATDDPDKTHFGGNTSCVEVNAHDGSHIIFDSGTGIRSLGNRIADEHDSEYEINLFLSHTHWDHILGFPFFAPIHQSFANINIYGPRRSGASLEKLVLGLFQPPYFPLTPEDIEAHVSFTEIDTGSVKIGDNVTVFSNPHPHPNGALGYRLEIGERSVVFITDIEHSKGNLVESVVELSQGADILIHDSHFTPEDLPEHKTWGHSSWEECTALANQAGVKQLYLFHFSPNYSDDDIYAIEKRARKEFANTSAAHQGLTVELSAD